MIKASPEEEARATMEEAT
jgi:DNA invertase Pin-like site-specific DNA recombinase